MGYIFLLIALFAGATKGYCGKKTSNYVNEYKDAMLANSVRMALCILIGLGTVAAGTGGISALAVNRTTLLITLLSGTANAAFLVLWLLAVKKGAYMMLDVFCMIGILIPIIGCAALFGEQISINHIIGFAILLAAVCIMCSYNNSIKTKITFSSLILLLLCGVTNGLCDFSQKLFVKMSADVPISVFNFYTYAFSAVILICCYFFFAHKSESKEPMNFKPLMIYIPIMSVCLFLYSYFKTLAAGYLPSAQLYPLAQSGALILSSIMSAVFFGEKLTAKCIAGIAMSFAALIIINVL